MGMITQVSLVCGWRINLTARNEAIVGGRKFYVEDEDWACELEAHTGDLQVFEMEDEDETPLLGHCVANTDEDEMGVFEFDVTTPQECLAFMRDHGIAEPPKWYMINEVG